MTKNFTVNEPGDCEIRPASVAEAYLRCHEFESVSYWTDTYVALMKFGTQVQLVSMVLPFSYEHCAHCHWKKLSTIIEPGAQLNEGTDSLRSKDVVVYSGVADEKEAIKQMVEELRDRTKKYMEGILKPKG